MNEKTIKFDGKTVCVRMMDDRYIVNDCPQQPEHVETLKTRNGVRCEHMGVFPGRTPPVRKVIEDARKRHGNCAIIAWDGDYIVGILTFFPVEDLIFRRAEGWEQMEPHCKKGMLAVASCVLCSLVGHEYRGKGIGRAMAELMLDWARERGFKQVGAFKVSSGLASMLSDYEREMHGIDPAYPMGRTITFLDVEGFRTYVAEDHGRFAGFMVLETRNGECEIHEFYVIPEQRNSFVARALLNKAFDSCQKLVFNVFQSNVRVRTFAELLLQRTAVSFETSDIEIWGVKCLHYEIKLNKQRCIGI